MKNKWGGYIDIEDFSTEEPNPLRIDKHVAAENFERELGKTARKDSDDIQKDSR